VFVRELEAAGEDGQLAVGIDYTSRQLQSLIAADVPGVHFYVMNRSEAVAEVLKSVAVPNR
jgi:methylenetetrahydrofolate reductase (NADPH)